MFLDGVGLGEANPTFNPLAAARTPTMDWLFRGRLTVDLEPFAGSRRLFRHLDPCLGCAGLPQSATGQAALLTGHNAAREMNGHYGPYPGPTIRRLLAAGTLFSDVLAADGSACLANAFPPSYLRSVAESGRRMNAFVCAARMAGLDLFGLESYRAGTAVSADLDGAYLFELDPANPRLKPAQAGRRLARIASKCDLTFFDFWLSDAAGHRWSLADATTLIEKLDGFLAGLLPALGDVTLLITSDHGNVEDKRVRTHTSNAVPLLACGPAAPAFADASSLLDVAPAVRRALRVPAGELDPDLTPSLP